jgi:predicted TIM-barrel fold metal-dependent hydrolase
MNTSDHFSRRTFVRSLAAAALVSRSSAAPASTGWIDAHVHVWTPDMQRYPLGPAFAGKKDIAPRSFTPAELFAHCRPEGVNRVVLIQMSFYQFDNRYMLEAIAAHPGTFSGVALVDPDASGLRGTMQALRTAGVRGFRLSAAEKAKVEQWRESDGIKTMWKVAAESGMAICPLANPEALYPLAQMCKQFPRTTVVIDHCARLGAKEPINPRDLDQLCDLAKFENTYVKTSAFYALGEKRAPYTDLAPMIRRLYDAYGPRRLMWASDCPFQVQGGHTYKDSIALVRDRLDFLKPEDKAWMLRNTAEKVFFGS